MSNGLPEGWKNEKFNFCCCIVNGQVDPKVEPYASMMHIGNVNIEKHTGRLVDVSSAKKDGQISGKYLFDDNQVLYGKINPQFGKVAFPKFHGICSADIYPIGCDKKQLIPEFLFHALLDQNFLSYSVSVSGRTGMPKINRDDIELYSILLPPLQEQKKIAKILSSVDEVIETTETQINKLKDLKKGLMNELLTNGIGHTEFKDSSVGRIPAGWECMPLEDKVTLTPGYAFKSSDFSESGVPLIRMGNLYKNTLDLKRNSIYLPTSIIEKHKKFRVFPNDIILSMTGTAGKEDYGFAVKVPLTVKVSMLNQRVVKINSKSGIDQGFLLALLHSRMFLNEIYAVGAGTKQANLSSANILNVQVPFPPFQEQQKIASILTSIDTNIEQKQNKLTQSKNLKKSLMADLLTGRVRVKT